MSIADKLKGVKLPQSKKRNTPLWKGPTEDGITQSLLSRFLVCRERFRLKVIEGLAPEDRFSHYRERYETKKAELKQLHPNYSDMRCHRHGMLVATKTLLKHLWMDWNDYPPMPKY